MNLKTNIRAKKILQIQKDFISSAKESVICKFYNTKLICLRNTKEGNQIFTLGVLKNGESEFVKIQWGDPNGSKLLIGLKSF